MEVRSFRGLLAHAEAASPDLHCPPVSIICLLLSVLSFPLFLLPDDSLFIHGMDKYSIFRAFYSPCSRYILSQVGVEDQNYIWHQCYYCFDHMNRLWTEFSCFFRRQTQFWRPKRKNVNDFVNQTTFIKRTERCQSELLGHNNILSV